MRRWDNPSPGREMFSCVFALGLTAAVVVTASRDGIHGTDWVFLIGAPVAAVFLIRQLVRAWGER